MIVKCWKALKCMRTLAASESMSSTSPRDVAKSAQKPDIVIHIMMSNEVNLVKSQREDFLNVQDKEHSLAIGLHFFFFKSLKYVVKLKRIIRFALPGSKDLSKARLPLVSSLTRHAFSGTKTAVILFENYKSIVS